MQQAKISVLTERIRTYPEPAPEDMPVYAENRVHQRSTGRPYPNKIVLNVERGPTVDREYTVVRLENDWLSVDILPEIGGRIFAARDKITGYDFFYRQHVIKPALIGVLGSWISGGVEFNWPFHHRASGFMPCDFQTETYPDGSVACHLSEHEPMDRMKGMFSILLRPDSAYLETRMRLYNRTELPKSFLWWENAAVPVNEQYRIFFPKDVTYVSFHYLKSRAPYPIADACTYNGIPFTSPVDISKHKNTRDATSYFSAASKYDFFGGYDEGKQCGVVHVADHHISPGKKMFTWGYNQLSRSWERALTDTDGAYAELMAGSYSDNQPNFSWLAPYETKCFSQFWYPITQIGAPDYADLHGAVTLDREENLLRMQFTEYHDAVSVRVSDGDTILAACSVSAAPCSPVTVPVPGLSEHPHVTMTVTAEEKTLFSYTEREPDRCAIPAPISDTPSADTLADVQKLYLAGVHVDQYRDPAVYPDAYWKRALALQPDHIPSLLAMAKFSYRYCRYADALSYADRAYRAQSLFNERPESGEVSYVRGLILEALGRTDEAYDAYALAAWDGNTADRAMTRVSMLDLLRKDLSAALLHTETALSHNTKNNLAVTVRVFALRALGEEADAQALTARTVSADPFAYSVRFASGEEPSAVFASMCSDPVQTTLDSVWEFARMGQEELCIRLLTALDAFLPDEKTPAFLYLTLAYFRKKQGADVSALLRKAAVSPVGRTYPNRAEEFAVLAAFAETSEIASYLLGCLAYAKHRFADAEDAWLRVRKPSFAHYAVVLRCLALLKFNHSEDREGALPLMREALENAPAASHAQLLYETVILLDKSGAPAEENLTLLKNDPDTFTRDDLVTELAKAYNRNSQPKEALAVLEARNFTPCEGGEHAIAEQYMFAHWILAQRAYAAEDFSTALEQFRAAQVLPEHLGAGIWNRCRLVPYRYGEALCLRALGERGTADAILSDITKIEIDYFSNMHLKELPYYQALCDRLLGRDAAGCALMTEYRRRWADAMNAKDSGYYATTPFFLPFVERAEDLRYAQYAYLSALCARYRGERDEAVTLARNAYGKNTENLFAGWVSGSIR